MVLKLRDELGQLLHEDGDMAELYLSRKLASAAMPGDENDVDEVEMLLEVYIYIYIYLKHNILLKFN